MVFYVCAWVTEMDYARKTDRATGQSVRETGCASETVTPRPGTVPIPTRRVALGPTRPNHNSTQPEIKR